MDHDPAAMASLNGVRASTSFCERIQSPISRRDSRLPSSHGQRLSTRFAFFGCFFASEKEP